MEGVCYLRKYSNEGKIRCVKLSLNKIQVFKNEQSFKICVNYFKHSTQ